MSRFDTFIFDFDLTLVDSRGPILKCFQHTLAAFGYPVPEDKTITDTIGIPLTDAFDVLTGLFQNPDKQKMTAEYISFANDIMARESIFYPDALGVLQSLSLADCRTAVVSSKMRFRIVETFEFNVDNIPLDLIVGLDDVKTPKPAPDGLLYAIDKLGSDKDKTLYIGDSYIDAQTAENAGVAFAGVTTGNTPADELKMYKNIAVADSLSELILSI